jgi:nucleotide-binding universal stress UspA family protein
VFADTSQRVVHQAAWLARRFHAEMILLHVVTPLSYPAGLMESGHEITARDLHASIVQRAQKDLDQALRPELDEIAVTRVLLRGDPASEIVKTARDQNVDLIAMSTRGEGTFYRFLLGSVTAKVLHEIHCPVWTGAHLEEATQREFSIRHVLCSVDLSPHSHHTASLAAEMAAAVNATLTLVHITASVEFYGPGGSHLDPVLKEKTVGFAAEEIAKLQNAVGTHAEVIIDSGNVPELLNRAAERTKSDVLVIGHIPGRSHLGDNGNGYGIIRESHIPVLSV